MAEYEADVRIRRNGRIVRWEKALGDTAMDALQGAVNDLERDLWGTQEADRG